MKEKLLKIISNILFIGITGAVGYFILAVIGMLTEDMFEYICRHNQERKFFYPSLGIGTITIFGTIAWLFGWAILRKR